MSLLSRSTGGRRFARTSAVIAGTLLTWLVVAAIPAHAATTCAPGPVPNSVQITTDPDDRVILQGSVAGGWLLREDGAPAPTPCGGAGSVWLNITGSNAGQETLVIYQGQTMGGAEITADLGNGTDSLVFEYGDTVWNSAGGPVPLPDPGLNQNMGLGSTSSGTVVSLDAAGGPGDMLFNNIENLTANGGSGNDAVDAGNLVNITATDVLATTTLDNIPASNDPLASAITFNGEAGTDTFVSGDGSDTFAGGPDADLVAFITSSAGVTVDLGAGTGTGQGSDSLSDVQGVIGSNFADTITGSSIDNTIDGADGDDTLNGGAGNDTIAGGLDSPIDANTDGGADHLIGGAGNDTENGGDGDDVIDEEAAINGADNLAGGSGGETVGDTLDYSQRTISLAVTAGAGAANDGQDTNADGDASDTGDEQDTVAGDFENYLGGSANDRFEGTGANEVFQPGGGDDFVDGNGGNDILDVSESTTNTTIDLPAGTADGDGNDTFVEIEGAATGSGDDTMLVDDTVLPIDFASDGGTDTVDASARTLPIILDLSTFGNGEEVENAIGGSGDDLITGTNQSNELFGMDGEDVINSGLGNDFVEGGLGNDVLNDGGGFDTLSYRNAPAGEEIDTRNGFATGGDGDDALGGGWEEVLGSDFADTITGGQSSVDTPNQLRGFAGDDLINGTNSTDTIKGGKGNDELRGGGGDDVIKGSGGNDLEIGSTGDDTLKGGNGNDELQGGKGFDVGNGGKGDDFCNGVESAHSC